MPMVCAVAAETILISYLLFPGTEPHQNLGGSPSEASVGLLAAEDRRLNCSSNFASESAARLFFDPPPRVNPERIAAFFNERKIPLAPGNIHESGDLAGRQLLDED